jgi:hypothetical protein
VRALDDGRGGRHGEEKRQPTEAAGEDGCTRLGLGQRGWNGGVRREKRYQARG